MSAPKTLLQMAGADTAPNTLSQSTLLVIDAQNEYLSGALPLSGVQDAMDEIALLLQRARAASAPVVHVQHAGRPGGLFDVSGPGGAIADMAKPQSGEPVVEKALPNAFAETSLQEHLEAAGRKKLVVAGFMTHMCVSATVRAALDHGYQACVVASACATRDLPDPLTGGAIAAQQLHAATLAALSDRFATIAQSAGDIPD